MREIKYRAWHKTLNIMCDVAAINFYYGNVVLLARNDDQSKLFQKMNKEALIHCDDRLSVSMNEVNLMQYSETTDKNAKRICEGDIYHMGDKNIRYIVVWNDNGLTGKQIGSRSYAGLLYWKDRIEIIGNIYNNPQLLST